MMKSRFRRTILSPKQERQATNENVEDGTACDDVVDLHDAPKAAKSSIVEKDEMWQRAQLPLEGAQDFDCRGSHQLLLMQTDEAEK